jgi:hypothetical protein
MAQQIFPIDANDMIIEATLDDGQYIIGLSWNQLAQFWTMSLRDLNFSVLCSGMMVIPRWPLLFQTRQPEFPPGEIYVDCNKGVVLDRYSFVNGSAAILYLSEADLYG